MEKGQDGANVTLAGGTRKMERDAGQNGTVLGEDEGVDDFCRL